MAVSQISSYYIASLQNQENLGSSLLAPLGGGSGNAEQIDSVLSQLAAQNSTSESDASAASSATSDASNAADSNTQSDSAKGSLLTVA
jgi:hypothetical protein